MTFVQIAKLLRACSLERRKSNDSFPPKIVGLVKELNIFLQSVNEKEDAFRMFTDWF